MIQRNYYALVAGLPDIVPDEKKTIFSSIQFREMLHEQIHQSDYELVKLFFLPFDHQNLLHLLFQKEKEWDKRGIFSQEELDLLRDKKSYESADLTGYPDYIVTFAEQFHGEESVETIFEAEQMLVNGYFEYLLKQNNAFVREVANYKMTVANIMTALNGRKHNLSFDAALVGSGDVVAALKKSRARDFGLSAEVSDIEQLIQIFENENLLERELKMDQHQWNFLDDATFFNYFTIEKVLAFLQKLFIVERWMTLNTETGEKMFNQLLKEYESGFQFPEEFTIAYGKK
ncbi:DUF2764 family protein [Geofilum sp. OHC36d9]|uniref:DUF2764 family protein n=1 Tax=Geofilum sp. OHC36d9 TaxID=3458413 RepID=UPI004034E117